MNALTALLALAALAGAAHAQVQSEFSKAAGKDVWDVARFNPPEFALMLGDDGPFAFYDEVVKCERTAGFGFIAQANHAGGILVGICTREAQRVRALAVKAEPALKSLIAELARTGPPIDTAALQKAGLTYAKNSGADGTEEYLFPVLVVGHGILAAQTVVRVPRGARRAIVVQADTMHLCENWHLANPTPLCTNTRQALAEIARRLEARFPN